MIKGGHLSGDSDDCIAVAGMDIQWLSTPRINTRHTHGTGCTFSAAIAAFLARGFTTVDAIREAKGYLTKAIEGGAEMTIGQGNGPVHHFHEFWGKKRTYKKIA